MLKATLGVIFLFAVSEQCRHYWVIMLLGILWVFGAVTIITNLEKMKALTNFFAQKSEGFLRAPALLYLFIGAIVIYSS